MSRCFPFPPPGYEKKARTDDVDSLIKDKYKEKKQKKEKKDKKKEGKDKDKERSKDKDREKKERKEKHKDKDKDKDKEKKKSKDKKTDEYKIEAPLDDGSTSGGKQNESNLQAETFKDAKLMAIGQRIADEERGGRDQMVENLPASDASKNDAVAMVVDKYFQEKEKVEDKDDHKKKVERQSIKPEGSIFGNSSVPSFSGAEQKRTEGTVKPTEKDSERKMEGKEKKKDQGVIDKRKEKHKHRDGEKKNKEKKAEKEKVKEKVKHENRKDKTIEVPKSHINTLNIQIPQDSEKSRSMEDNPRKRKDCETNGFLHDNALHNKLARPNLSSHLLTVNGKKSEPCQPASPFASPMPRGINNLRFDSKVLIANGLIKEQPSSVSSTSLSIPRMKARANGESSENPPHPDAKYLSKILTVPKMDDLSDFDDQEWLFNNDSQVKKPKAVSSGVDGSPQVWDRALRIDSADVCALPYVIPY